MWIEYKTEVYDVGNMIFIRTLDRPTTSPQYVREEPVHFSNIGNNYKELYLSLTNSEPLSYHKNAPQHIEKFIKSVKRIVMKKENFKFWNSQTFS